MVPHPTRRTALLSLGAAIVPLGTFAGCSGNSGAAAPDGSAADATPDTPGGDTCGAAPGAWASGGTAAMTARDCYPDPFAAAVATCPLVVCATTPGPCTAPTTERGDVSEGYPGLPVRLALKLVTADTCAPIAGAVVEI